MVDENNVGCIFYDKAIIRHEFMADKQTANCRFYKGMI
jgi:hypothetical protein